MQSMIYIKCLMLGMSDSDVAREGTGGGGLVPSPPPPPPPVVSKTIFENFLNLLGKWGGEERGGGDADVLVCINCSQKSVHSKRPLLYKSGRLHAYS